MQSRRSFFGNLGIIIAAAAAPSIFLPSEPIGWKPTIRQVRYKLKTIWTPELEQDLMAYHGIDASAEMDALLRCYVEEEIGNAELVRIDKNGPIIRDDSWLSPRREVYAIVNERV